MDGRHLSFLQALCKSAESLERDGRRAEWVLIQMSGNRQGLKPGIPDSGSIAEADIHTLVDEQYARLLPSSRTVVLKFALTDSGRSAGRPVVVTDLNTSLPPAAPPGLDDVLGWLGELQKSGPGAALLASGAGVVNQAVEDFGSEHLDAVARHLIALKDEGLIQFVDPLASVDQLPVSDRLGRASEFRLRTSGLDRLSRTKQEAPQVIQQVVHAAQAQVAAGDINNYATYGDLLDALEARIEEIQGVDEDAKEEARGLLGKLRSAGGQAATGAVASAGGALLGSLLKQLLNLPDA